MDKTWEIPSGDGPPDLLIWDRQTKCKRKTDQPQTVATLFFSTPNLVNQNQANKAAEAFKELGLHLRVDRHGNYVDIDVKTGIMDEGAGSSIVIAIIDELVSVILAEQALRATTVVMAQRTPVNVTSRKAPDAKHYRNRPSGRR